VLVKSARKLAQQYNLTYQEQIPTSQLVQRVANVMQEYTQQGYVSYTIKQRVYVFISLFVCMFTMSSVLLTNRLTQALQIRIDYSVNFWWSSKHIFIFLSFVIQKLRVF